MNDKSIYDARLMKLNTEHALSTVKNFHFDGGKASRLISGIAISSCLPKANDTSFLAKGVDSKLRRGGLVPVGSIIACASSERPKKRSN